MTPGRRVAYHGTHERRRSFDRTEVVATRGAPHVGRGERHLRRELRRDAEPPCGAAHRAPRARVRRVRDRVLGEHWRRATPRTRDAPRARGRAVAPRDGDRMAAARSGRLHLPRARRRTARDALADARRGDVDRRPIGGDGLDLRHVPSDEDRGRVHRRLPRLPGVRLSHGARGGEKRPHAPTSRK